MLRREANLHGECAVEVLCDEIPVQALARDKHVIPWRIEDTLKELGANYVHAGLWKGFAIRDGNLLTGQQNFSGGEVAQLLLETLGR
jgi:putative intracellular protease/amidase